MKSSSFAHVSAIWNMSCLNPDFSCRIRPYSRTNPKVGLRVPTSTAATRLRENLASPDDKLAILRVERCIRTRNNRKTLMISSYCKIPLPLKELFQRIIYIITYFYIFSKAQKYGLMVARIFYIVLLLFSFVNINEVSELAFVGK